jgi:hypothetical protein
MQMLGGSGSSSGVDSISSSNSKATYLFHQAVFKEGGKKSVLQYVMCLV